MGRSKARSGNRFGHGGKRNVWQQDQQRDQRQNYQLSYKENDVFEKYYKEQGFIAADEWETFMSTMRDSLPSTFRITGNRNHSKQLLETIKGKYLGRLMNADVEGEEREVIEPPKCLPWYPNELAWQLNFDRKRIRTCEALKKLHHFLVTETESGNISRQEAVSMIPPLVMDIQSHHKVLDMCAAPGSKTSQLIEMLHADEDRVVPEGMVVANDSDNKRCYLMTHQVKRLSSPCFVIINHDAANLPSFKLAPKDSDSPIQLNMKFDRILADVPCSGDGTMRKNPDIWRKWNPNTAHNLHGIQKRVLKRGLSLLNPGGRLVYSTCSLNPVENEAVIAHVLSQKAHIDTCELVDVSSQLPGLKSSPGITDWKILTRDKEWLTSHEEVPQRLMTQISRSMFPPSKEQAEQLHLSRCIRILPHYQNTGGFFVAVIQKNHNAGNDPEPSEGPACYLCGECGHLRADCSKNQKAKEGTDEQEVKVDSGTASTDTRVSNGQSADSAGGEEAMPDTLTQDTTDTASTEEAKTEADKQGEVVMETETVSEEADPSKKRKDPESPEHREPKRTKKQLIQGYKEDPFIFLDHDDAVWPAVKEFFGVKDDFPQNQLMVRCMEGKKRNIYFASKAVRDLAVYNEDRHKFINMGIKMFSRSSSVWVPDCDYRLVQDGINILEPYITKRRVPVVKEDLVTLLDQENPFMDKMSLKSRQSLNELGQGAVLFIYEPDDRPDSPQSRIALCGWRGKASCRSFLPKDERAHFLRMCGMELRTKEEKRKEKQASTLDAVDLDLAEKQPEPSPSSSVMSTDTTEQPTQVNTDCVSTDTMEQPTQVNTDCVSREMEGSTPDAATQASSREAKETEMTSSKTNEALSKESPENVSVEGSSESSHKEESVSVTAGQMGE